MVRDNKTVRKNIDLPKWVVDDFSEMADINRNKFKPFIELTLINSAKRYRKAKASFKNFTAPKMKKEDVICPPKKAIIKTIK
jgi:hypothetical protein